MLPLIMIMNGKVTTIRIAIINFIRYFGETIATEIKKKIKIIEVNDVTKIVPKTIK